MTNTTPAAPVPTLSHQLLSATAWNTLLLPARFMVGIFASVVYYQVLGREEVGLAFLLTSLATTIGLYADLGIERSLPRFLPEVESGYGRQGVVTLLKRVVAVKLAILGVLVLLLFAFSASLGSHLAERQSRAAEAIEARIAAVESPAERTALEQRASEQRSVARLIEGHGAALVGAVAALLVLGALFDVAMQFLAAYFKQKAWNLVTLATLLLQPILVTTLVLAGLGVGGVLIALVATSLASLLLAAFQVRSAARSLAIASEARPLAAGVWRRLARFAGMNYLIQLTTWLYDLEVVVFLSTAFLGLTEAAVLGFAYKFTRDALGNIWTPLTGVMTPLLVRIKARQSGAALRDAHASLTRLILLLLVPAGVGLVLLAPRLIALLYPKYTAAIPLIVIFVFFTFAESILSVPHNTLMVYERYRPVIASRLVPLVSLPLLAFVVPRFGAIGVALVVGLTRVVSRLVSAVAAARGLGLGFPFAFAGRIAIACVSFGIVVALLLRGPAAPEAATDALAKAAALAPLVGIAVLGAGLYLLALRATGGLHPDERRRVLALPLPFRNVLRHFL